MPIDWVPILPPSGGYEKIVTPMDVFSRNLFAYPTSNQQTITITGVKMNIMIKHAYSPTTIISDDGLDIVSHVISQKVAVVLGNTLKHVTKKYAQTFGILERSHASHNQALKIETGERRSMWQI